MKSIFAAALATGMVVCFSAHASFDDGARAYRAGDYLVAIGEWRPLAKKGDRAAQFGVGLSYANGRGVPQDLAEAARWYRMSAEQGLPTAQFELGNLYLTGQGVARDLVEAVRWYRRAADQGMSLAQLRLAYAYEVGSGVAKDPGKAAAWYERAAAQGIARAQQRLAALLEQGVSPEKLSGPSKELQSVASGLAKVQLDSEAYGGGVKALGQTNSETEAPSKELQAASQTPRRDVRSEPVERQSDGATEQHIESLADSLRVRLASYRDRSKADKGWQILLGKHRDLLGSLSYVIVPVDLGSNKGQFLRLEVGPLATSTQASALCTEIKRRGDDCVAVQP